ncbi:MAG: hypothetical protein Q4C58_15965 [Eubacteriales bacterium]|nr:hypothetical protein [Eubacteriales bacterium]
MMYSIRNKCEEVPEMEYEDGLRFYYFYTDGTKGGSDRIRKLLRYLKDSREENATDEATKEIHSYVKQVKIQPEVKLAYMRYEEIIYYERKEAAEEAAKEAVEKATEEAIKNIISVCRNLNVTQETAAKQLAEKYSLSLPEAEEKVKNYWES